MVIKRDTVDFPSAQPTAKFNGYDPKRTRVPLTLCQHVSLNTRSQYNFSVYVRTLRCLKRDEAAAAAAGTGTGTRPQPTRLLWAKFVWSRLLSVFWHCSEMYAQPVSCVIAQVCKWCLVFQLFDLRRHYKYIGTTQSISSMQSQLSRV